MGVCHPYVAINRLHFNYGGRNIFSSLDMTIRQAKVTAIMGPSGSGKTTLLRLMGAQLVPDKGTIRVADQDIHKLSRKALYKMRRQMGLLFQSSALFTDLTVFENVAFPLHEHLQLPPLLLRDLVWMKLEAVGLRGAASLMPNELSGGMARRVALARALALDPQLMMYDEPFTGQDPISIGVLSQLIRQLNDALGMTSIIVSHDVEATLAVADYIYIISQGTVIAEGTPEFLKNCDQSPEVSQFLQGRSDGTIPFHYPAKNFAEELMRG